MTHPLLTYLSQEINQREARLPSEPSYRQYYEAGVIYGLRMAKCRMEMEAEKGATDAKH